MSPWLFNLYAEYMMKNAGLDESEAGIKIAERNINNLRYEDNMTPEAEREELERWGNSANSVRLYFLGLPNHCRW